MRYASSRRHPRAFVALLGALLLAALTPVVAGAVGTSVAGSVVDSEGTPLAGIAVAVEDGFGNVLNVGTTFGDGTYQIGGIEQYSGVVVRASDPLGFYYTLDSHVDQTLTAGAVNAGRDFTFDQAGRVAGRVVDGLGAGVPGIWVYALGTDGLGDEAILFSTTTDLNGDYMLGGVEPGPHWIAYRDQGVPQTYISEYYDNVEHFNDANAAQFTTGTPTALKGTVLQAYGWVQGTVLDASSTPIAVSSVEAYRYNPWSEQWEYLPAVQVDEFGNYTLALLPGTYRLKAKEDNNTYVHKYYPDSTTIEGASDVVVSAKTTITAYNFVLEQAGHIAGTVTPRAGGALLHPVYVEAFRRSEGGSMVSVTIGEHPAEANAETGAYDVHINFTGDVYLRFTSNAYASVWYPGVPYASGAATVSASVGGTLSDVNQVVDLRGTIAGKVTNSSGAALEGVTVEVYDARTGDSLGGQWATTGVGGTYVVEGLDLAEYKLRFWDDARRVVPEWYNNVATEASATPVLLTSDARNITGINASLAPSGKISGTITSKSTGKPLAGVKVSASEIDPIDGWTEDTFVAYTDSSGNYSVSGAFTGYAKVWAEDPRYVGRWYSDKPDRESATLIPTAAGSTVHGIDIALQPGASISGSIKDGLGSPIFDSFVEVYRKVGGEWRWVRQDSSDGGVYKATSLEAGTYAVRFWSGDGFAQEYYDNARSLTSATPVVLAAAQAKSGVDAVLGKGGKIAGTITGTAVGPTAEAIDVETGDTYFAWVEGSSYVIEQLPPAKYKVIFLDRPDAGDPTAAPEFYNNAVEYSEAETLTVTEGGTLSNIDAVLSGERSSISGTFTAGLDGVPGRVGVVRADVDQMVGDYYWREAKADSRGSFKIDNLRPGDYRLYFDPDDSAYYPFYYPGVVSPALATTFTVDGAFASEFDVVEKGTLDLSIRGVGGAGIGPRRGSIRLWYDAGAAGWLEVTSGYASGVQGYSSFESLFPGSYKIQFVDLFGGYRNTFYGGSTIESATAVEVSSPMITGLGGVAPPAPPAPGPIVIPLSHMGTSKTRVTLSASVKTPSYGYSTSLVGQVSDINGWPFAGKSVKLYSAAKSSGPWTYRTTLKTGSNGRTPTYNVKPSVLTYYRIIYTGPDSVTKTATVAIKPKAYLTLSAPTTAKRNTAFSFGGSLKPRHTVGTTVTKIYAYRYVGGQWKYTKYAYGKAYNYSTYSKYSGKISLPYAGKWKLVAVHSDTGHTSRSSSARYVTVK